MNAWPEEDGVSITNGIWIFLVCLKSGYVNSIHNMRFLPLYDCFSSLLILLDAPIAVFQLLSWSDWFGNDISLLKSGWGWTSSSYCPLFWTCWNYIDRCGDQGVQPKGNLFTAHLYLYNSTYFQYFLYHVFGSFHLFNTLSKVLLHSFITAVWTSSASSLLGHSPCLKWKDFQIGGVC